MEAGTPITAALKEATSTIPIVFSPVNDPVGQGFVASLSRPGGNVTGFIFIDFPLIGKWLEMIKDIAPRVRYVALMFNPDTSHDLNQDNLGYPNQTRFPNLRKFPSAMR